MEDQGLNPMDLKSAAGFLEYILLSEGEILWMHFDEAQRIEEAAKNEAYDVGFSAGHMQAFKDWGKQFSTILEPTKKYKKFTTDEQ